MTGSAKNQRRGLEEALRVLSVEGRAFESAEGSRRGACGPSIACIAHSISSLLHHIRPHIMSR